MTRVAILIVALIAGAASACGEGDMASSSPTGPSGGSGSQSPGGGCSLPSAPNDLTVSVSGSTVLLSWSGVNGAEEYVILAGTSRSSSNILLTNTTQNRYPWGGISPGTYFVRVQSKNACGTSGSSNEISFTITG